jgi:acyl carrier protein
LNEKETRIMLDKLKELISDQLNVDADSVVPEAKFKEDLEADSLDLFELVMALEEEYGVEIPSEDLEKITTVGAVVEYMKNKGVEA